MCNRYAIYTRVSTQRQGRSGLGLESQQNVCKKFISDRGGEFVKEFRDVESGTHRDRKGLLDAISFCKTNDCALVFAKLDRLARDVEFCFKVVNTGIEIHFCDMPQVNTLILGMFATIGQYERELVSTRTKAALAVKKEQGCKLGASNDKYKESYNNKSMEEKVKCHRKKGQTKTERYLTSRDVTAFIRVLKTQFPESTQGEITEWDWDGINTKDGVRQPILQMMNNIHEIDNNVFRKWNFSDIESVALQRKLSQYIYGLRRSALKKQLFDSEDKSEY